MQTQNAALLKASDLNTSPGPEGASKSQGNTRNVFFERQRFTKVPKGIPKKPFLATNGYFTPAPKLVHKYLARANSAFSDRALVETRFEGSQILVQRHLGASKTALTKAGLPKHDFPLPGKSLLRISFCNDPGLVT